jgi:ferritin-like metal-binding protein YciE
LKVKPGNLERTSGQMGQETRNETFETDGGLISDGQRSLQEAESDLIRDPLVADAPAKVEHFEIACYRALIARASRGRTGMYMGASYPSEGSGTPVPNP